MRIVHGAQMGGGWAVTDCGGYRGLRRGYGGVEGGFFWVSGGFCPIFREGRFLALSGKVFKISAGEFLGGLGEMCSKSPDCTFLTF